MERVNEIILDLMGQLTTLNENLAILSSENGGIVIHDTFANVSTWVDLVATIVATVFGALIGGRITIQLFKQQEKMRIKQELRLEFYKGYKSLYEEFEKSFLEYKEDANKLKIALTINPLITLDLKIIKHDYEGGPFKLKHSSYKKYLNNIINASSHTYTNLKKIENYIEMNKIILNKYKGTSYKNLVVKVSDIHDKMKDLKYYQDIIDRYNSMVSGQDKLNVQDIIDGYNSSISDIPNLDKALEDLLKEIKKIHSDMETEFLAQYFK